MFIELKVCDYLLFEGIVTDIGVEVVSVTEVDGPEVAAEIETPASGKTDSHYLWNPWLERYVYFLSVSNYTS